MMFTDLTVSMALALDVRAMKVRCVRVR